MQNKFKALQTHPGAYSVRDFDGWFTIFTKDGRRLCAGASAREAWFIACRTPARADA